jgi:NAD(P)-dependent dehydrogenase (short-subunit alcohol dehydrogenase family)
MTKRLDGKNAIITGGATGIGFTVAQTFVREGASVALLDIDGAKAEQAAKSLCDGGAKAIGVAADVCSESDTSQAVAKAESFFGGPATLLMNNAGIAGFGSIETTSVEDWNKIFAVNVTGTFLTSKAVIPGMLKEGQGSIINVGSVAAMCGLPSLAAYCSAKGAVVSLTRQMAAEYSPRNIRVNCINPGVVPNTDMGQSLVGGDSSEEAKAKRLAKYPIGRFGEPQDIADAALYLASSESNFVTGTFLAVDGGMTMI